MALKFIGERTIGALNGMRDGFVKDDLYRVYDAGILMPGGVSVSHGDFVSWDGTKWKLEVNIKIARSDEITNTNSSIAPNYTKQTYEANSYVMQGGVLYTNSNAINTAEDWNPAHWTQTTVAEMMASAGNSGYTQVDLTFDVNATKTIPVGQKEEVHVDCTFKVTDDVVIQFAEDCTDAVVILTRANSTAPRTFKTMRGSTVLPLYGADLITDVNPQYIEDYERFLLTSHYEEGEHGEGSWSTPEDFYEIDLNGNEIVGNVVPRSIKSELLNYRIRQKYLIVAKGSIVMCLPGD
jgi:hypothetical protein